ncbi:hypothetical protein RHGRI_038941 [Rhododendron griersonianum]|uniref:Leucine-rich repeat-containing N-terminal plant-type domain-containing protein n=1 Tax=Rhododendron griersonianum TaxID=479676 RepID=A0AAV6HNF0_9ERIC|nr:hypothetical protein RHGRI_038941 [Rhododendron griersonianum]
MSQGESHEPREKIGCLTPLIGFRPTEMSQENLQESKKLGEASQKTEIVSPFIDQKQFHPTEMSTQWGNVHVNLQDLSQKFVEASHIIKSFSSFIYHKQFHPTDTSQGGDDQQKLQEFSEKLGQAAQKTESFSSSACIYRVPAELRALKRSAYAPRLISIGPYHRKHHLLRSPMQQVKMSYANSLLRRVGSVEKKEFTEVLRECLEQMKMWKDDANKCYADDDISDGDLLDEEMMVVDGLQSAIASGSTSGNETDRIALLDFKKHITQDPFQIMPSWNDSIQFCNWVGVECNPTNGRVMVFNLESQNLSGSIPPSIGNLTFLTGFNLKHNNFQGEIPQEIGRLIRLQHLNLSFNSFSGKIPMLKIGLLCSASLPRARMPMNIVVNKMYAIRDSFQRSKKRNDRTTP